MDSRDVVFGRHVEEKRQLARRMRREMTLAEEHLWEGLRQNRLHGIHFRRQQVIDGFIVDFYCASAGLVIEVDGDVHTQQAEYDEEREQVLSVRGLRTVRFTNEQVLCDTGGVLAEIQALL